MRIKGVGQFALGAEDLKSWFSGTLLVWVESSRSEFEIATRANCRAARHCSGRSMRQNYNQSARR